jgi:hypothetical protein
MSFKSLGALNKRLEKNVSTRELIDNVFVSSGEENGFFCIDFFPGLVSECKPRILDALVHALFCKPLVSKTRSAPA